MPTARWQPYSLTDGETEPQFREFVRGHTATKAQPRPPWKLTEHCAWGTPSLREAPGKGPEGPPSPVSWEETVLNGWDSPSDPDNMMSKQMERGRLLLNRGLPAQWLFVTGSRRLQACLELRAGRVAAGQEDGWVLRATHCPSLSRWQPVPGITKTIIK